MLISAAGVLCALPNVCHEGEGREVIDAPVKHVIAVPVPAFPYPAVKPLRKHAQMAHKLLGKIPYGSLDLALTTDT